MILNIPLKYAINRFALGRARTKDEHKTAGKMQKSPSHCAGRWRYLVNPLQSSLSYKEKREKEAAQSFSQYLPLGLINCDPDLNKSQYLLIIILRHLFICTHSLYNESPFSTGNFTFILNA